MDVADHTELTSKSARIAILNESMVLPDGSLTAASYTGHTSNAAMRIRHSLTSETM